MMQRVTRRRADMLDSLIGGCETAPQLADDVGISQDNARHQLRGLLQLGWVTRSQQADRGLVRYTLTMRGRLMAQLAMLERPAWFLHAHTLGAGCESVVTRLR